MRVKMEGGNDGIEVGNIKPCPFCGKMDDLRVTNKETYESLVKEHGSSLVRVSCKKCNLEFTQYDIPNNDYGFGLGVVVTRWNNRK